MIICLSANQSYVYKIEYTPNVVGQTIFLSSSTFYFRCPSHLSSQHRVEVPTVQKMGRPSINSANTGEGPSEVSAINDSEHGLEFRGSIKTDDTSGDEEASVAEQHIFSDPVVAERWRKVYEEAQYENRHRFDPAFTWSPEEERKLVRKIDRRIMVCLDSRLPERFQGSDEN